MRSYTALRFTLIGYWRGCVHFLSADAHPDAVWASARRSRWSSRQVMQRQIRDPAHGGTALMVLEIVGDGVTVALFAMATLGGIMRVEDQV